MNLWIQYMLFFMLSSIINLYAYEGDLHDLTVLKNIRTQIKALQQEKNSNTSHDAAFNLLSLIVADGSYTQDNGVIRKSNIEQNDGLQRGHPDYENKICYSVQQALFLLGKIDGMDQHVNALWRRAQTDLGHQQEQYYAIKNTIIHYWVLKSPYSHDIFMQEHMDYINSKLSCERDHFQSHDMFNAYLMTARFENVLPIQKKSLPCISLNHINEFEVLSLPTEIIAMIFKFAIESDMSIYQKLSLTSHKAKRIVEDNTILHPLLKLHHLLWKAGPLLFLGLPIRIADYGDSLLALTQRYPSVWNDDDPIQSMAPGKHLSTYELSLLMRMLESCDALEPHILNALRLSQITALRDAFDHKKPRWKKSVDEMKSIKSDQTIRLNLSSLFAEAISFIWSEPLILGGCQPKYVPFCYNLHDYAALGGIQKVVHDWLGMRNNRYASHINVFTIITQQIDDALENYRMKMSALMMNFKAQN